jgi:hypothetical protein
MRKWNLVIAISFGAAIAASASLLLNLNGLIVVMSAMLLPGGLLSGFWSRTPEYSAPALFATNALLYSILVWVIVAVVSRKASVSALRRTAVVVGVPALILSCLAFSPALNPTWPQGMNELANTEKRLQDALPLGMDIQQARTVLQSSGLKFDEENEGASRVVLSREDKVVTASAGDRLLFSRSHTEAGQFPCGYDMQIVLLFGQDQKLKDRYVHRLRICP